MGLVMGVWLQLLDAEGNDLVSGQARARSGEARYLPLRGRWPAGQRGSPRMER